MVGYMEQPYLAYLLKLLSRRYSEIVSILWIVLNPLVTDHVLFLLIFKWQLFDAKSIGRFASEYKRISFCSLPIFSNIATIFVYLGLKSTKMKMWDNTIVREMENDYFFYNVFAGK